MLWEAFLAPKMLVGLGQGLETSRHCSKDLVLGIVKHWQFDAPENPENYFSYSYLGVLSLEDRLGKFRANEPCITGTGTP